MENRRHKGSILPWVELLYFSSCPSRFQYRQIKATKPSRWWWCRAQWAFPEAWQGQRERSLAQFGPAPTSQTVDSAVVSASCLCWDGKQSWYPGRRALTDVVPYESLPRGPLHFMHRSMGGHKSSQPEMNCWISGFYEAIFVVPASIQAWISIV